MSDGISLPLVGSLEEAAIALERTIDLQLTWSKDKFDEAEWRYADLAKALDLWERNCFWRSRGYASMNEWLESKAQAMQVSRGMLYQAKWIGSKLSRYLTGDQMREIGKSRLALLARVTKEGEAPPREFLDMAFAKVKIEEFEVCVKAKRPLLQGETQADLDLVKVQPFFVSRSEYAAARETFRLIRTLEGVESRDKIFMIMVELAHAHYLQERSEMMEDSGVPQ